MSTKRQNNKVEYLEYYTLQSWLAYEKEGDMRYLENFNVQDAKLDDQFVIAWEGGSVVVEVQ